MYIYIYTHNKYVYNRIYVYIYIIVYSWHVTSSPSAHFAKAKKDGKEGWVTVKGAADHRCFRYWFRNGNDTISNGNLGVVSLGLVL